MGAVLIWSDSWQATGCSAAPDGIPQIQHHRHPGRPADEDDAVDLLRRHLRVGERLDVVFSQGTTGKDRDFFKSAIALRASQANAYYGLALSLAELGDKSAAGAAMPQREASSASTSNSASDSTLKSRMPASSASRISSRALPTPEKTIRRAGTRCTSGTSASSSRTTGPGSTA